MSTISSYFSQFIASHFIKGLNVGNVGILLKCRTNVGILLKYRKCWTTGRLDMYIHIHIICVCLYVPVLSVIYPITNLTHYFIVLYFYIYTMYKNKLYIFTN